MNEEQRMAEVERFKNYFAYINRPGADKLLARLEEVNNLPLGHGEKSVIQIMRFMQLSEEEMLAIRWHMGAFDYATKGGSCDMNNAFAGSRLAVMLHIADMEATHLDERKEKHE